MTDQLVVELLTEWAKLSDNLLSGCDGLNDFSESILNNEDLFQAVTHVLEENDRFRSLYGDVIAVLFSLYRAPHGKLRVFSGQFIPSLIYVYLNQIHSQKKCVALETLLRGIFELELSFEEIIPASARIANVNLPSIYHDPGGVSTSWLSDNDLDRLNLKTVKTITRQALVLNDERIRAPQRLPLCVELWWIFNHRLPHMPKHSIPMHLKVITKLITQGFTPMNSQKLQPPVRIVLSSKLLIEMVQTAYFSAYNGSPTLAEQILDEISARANYQLWADALLACHAVQDYLKSSGTRERGQIYRHPFHSEKIFPKLLDINFEPDCLPCYRHQFSLFDMIQSKHHHPTSCYLSVVSRTAASYSNYSTELPIQVEVSSFKKSIITNASFRTKKLPDDIPIIERTDSTEEPETPTPTSHLHGFKAKSKIPHILAKIKRNSVVVINEEGDVETLASPPNAERKKSIDATAV